MILTQDFRTVRLFKGMMLDYKLLGIKGGHFKKRISEEIRLNTRVWGLINCTHVQTVIRASK